MNAFNARFTEFCAGDGDLDQVIAALESDLRNDRQSCERNSSLIELAWRTGKIDPDSYTTLKQILDQPPSPMAPIDSGLRRRAGESGHGRQSGRPSSPQTGGDKPGTRLRPSGPSVSPHHSGKRGSHDARRAFAADHGTRIATFASMGGESSALDRPWSRSQSDRAPC